MAYDATVAQPICMIPRVGSGPALWIYNSADAHGTVSGSGYFANGASLGMKVGDHMIVGKTGATEASTIHYVKTVVAGGAATVAAGVFS